MDAYQNQIAIKGKPHIKLFLGISIFNIILERSMSDNDNTNLKIWPTTTFLLLCPFFDIYVYVCVCVCVYEDPKVLITEIYNKGTRYPLKQTTIKNPNPLGNHKTISFKISKMSSFVTPLLVIKPQCVYAVKHNSQEFNYNHLCAHDMLYLLVCTRHVYALHTHLHI